MLIPDKNLVGPGGKVTSVKRYSDPAISIVVSDEEVEVAESGEDPTSTIDHGSLAGLGDDDHSQYHNDSRAETWLAANHETTYTHADISLNTTHRNSNGTDHGYIDQDVQTTASPIFAGLTITDAGNVALGTTTGTKLGTAASQKLGLFGVTPVVQQPHIADADGTLADATRAINEILVVMETLGIVSVS